MGYRICRNCDAMCGVLDEYHADSNDPISGGFICKQAAFEEINRISSCRKGSPAKEVSYEGCLQDVVSVIQNLSKSKKEGSEIGIYISSEVSRSSCDFLSALCFALVHNTKHIFSDISLHMEPLLTASEYMYGAPVPLLSDLRRSHYSVILGENPNQLHWGSHQLGQSHLSWLKHIKKQRNSKIITVHSESFDDMDSNLHVLIHPGTEAFFLLGMVLVSIERGWVDTQYLRDHTSNFELIRPILDDWSLERCANICGVDKAEISGVALKFSRSAMSVAHPGAGVLEGPNGWLAAWSYMAIHMISANALRPGGIYENEGGLDLQPFLATLLSQQSPQIHNKSLQWMQADVEDLFLSIKNKDISTLILTGDLPLHLTTKEHQEQLRQVEHLIVFARQESWLTELADYVFPISHPWENEDRILHNNISLPVRALPKTEKLRESPQNSRRVSTILSDISKKIYPAPMLSSVKTMFQDSPWGKHLRGIGFMSLMKPMEENIEALLDLILEHPPDSQKSSLAYRDESNRALWRPKNDRLDFSPTFLREALQKIHIPQKSDEFPYFLQTKFPVQRNEIFDDVIIKIHPNTYDEIVLSSQQNTSKVIMGRLETGVGSINCEIIIDENVKEGTVISNHNAKVFEILYKKESASKMLLRGISCRIVLLEK